MAKIWSLGVIDTPELLLTEIGGYNDVGAFTFSLGLSSSQLEFAIFQF